MPKFINMVKRSGKYVALAAAGLGATASSSMAALEAAQLTEIQTGISGSDANFYAIGGTILVVLAGVWGFKLVKRMF